MIQGFCAMEPSKCNPSRCRVLASPDGPYEINEREVGFVEQFAVGRYFRPFIRPRRRRAAGDRFGKAHLAGLIARGPFDRAFSFFPTCPSQLSKCPLRRTSRCVILNMSFAWDGAGQAHYPSPWQRRPY
jgi:hypothetical protein